LRIARAAITTGLAALLAASLTGAPAVRAQEPVGDSAGAAPAKVVIISMKACCAAEAWEAAEKTAAAEFSALGFDVETVDGTATDTEGQWAELGTIVEEKKAVCALRISLADAGSSKGADVWVNETVTGKTIYRFIPFEGSPDAEAASVVALRVVELLRASLLELTMAPEGAKEAGPPAEVVAMIEKKEPAPRAKLDKELAVPPPVSEPATGQVGLRLGAEALGSPGGMGAMGAVNLSLRWNFVPYLSAELDAMITFVTPSVRQGNASASFDISAVRGWLLWEFLRGRILRLCVGAGGGVLVAWSRGFVSGFFETRTDVTYSGYAGGTVQAAIVLSKNLWLRWGFIVGSSLPPIRVTFWDLGVARFGMPIMEGFLNIEIRVP
jgi:hypothetical protein